MSFSSTNIGSPNLVRTEVIASLLSLSAAVFVIETLQSKKGGSNLILVFVALETCEWRSAFVSQNIVIIPTACFYNPDTDKCSASPILTLSALNEMKVQIEVV